MVLRYGHEDEVGQCVGQRRHSRQEGGTRMGLVRIKLLGRSFSNNVAYLEPDQLARQLGDREAVDRQALYAVRCILLTVMLRMGGIEAGQV